MDIDLHREIALKFLIEVYQNGNVDILDAIIHPDYGPDEALEFLQQFINFDMSSGIDALKKRIMGIRDGLKNIKFEILQITAEDDNVIIFYKLNAIHTGAYLGIPATGNQFTVTGFHLFRFKNGKIHRIAPLQDQYKILRDVGRAVLEANREEDVALYLDALRKLRITK